MEDKHIYSTSFLSKLQDRVSEFAKEIQSIVQTLAPKRTKKKSPTVPMEPLKTEVPQTPITTSVAEIKIDKPKIKKQKVKRVKKERVKKVHFRKFADERAQKILVISLATAIISIFGFGVYQTYKDVLYPQALQNSYSKSQEAPISPTPNTTTNWKTYTNNQYRFSFKYSAQYKLQESNLGNGDFKVFLIMDPVEQTARGVTVMKNVSLSDTINGIKTKPSYIEKILEEKSISIGGNDGILFVVSTTKGPTKTEIALVEKYDNVYRFDWLDSQTLSTFKFLD